MNLVWPVVTVVALKAACAPLGWAAVPQHGKLNLGLSRASVRTIVRVNLIPLKSRSPTAAQRAMPDLH
jgi:hypothetical protein